MCTYVPTGSCSFLIPNCQEADEAVQLGRDPLVNFHLVARSESRSAGSGYHTLAVTRRGVEGPEAKGSNCMWQERVRKMRS